MQLNNVYRLVQLTAIEIWEVKVNDEYEEEKEEPEKNQANGEEMIEE